VVYKGEISDELDSCARELEELGQLCQRRVRVFEELLAVFNCSVLTFWSAIKFHRE
jgi:hypothetical protein